MANRPGIELRKIIDGMHGFAKAAAREPERAPRDYSKSIVPGSVSAFSLEAVRRLNTTDPPSAVQIESWYAKAIVEVSRAFSVPQRMLMSKDVELSCETWSGTLRGSSPSSRRVFIDECYELMRCRNRQIGEANYFCQFISPIFESATRPSAAGTLTVPVVVPGEPGIGVVVVREPQKFSAADIKGYVRAEVERRSKRTPHPASAALARAMVAPVEDDARMGAAGWMR